MELTRKSWATCTNLFGLIRNAVHIQLTPKGYQIEHVVKGDTMSEVGELRTVQLRGYGGKNPQRCEHALEENRITLTGISTDCYKPTNRVCSGIRICKS